jgi:radical SAM protein with 4Fe4S-binding SPASM domain
MMKECGPYVVIEHNGNIYSCDFFVEPRWKLGNIMHDRIINMLNSKNSKRLRAKTLLPRECGFVPGCAIVWRLHERPDKRSSGPAEAKILSVV